MVDRRFHEYAVLGVLLTLSSVATAEQAGSIRGTMYDQDFDAALNQGKVEIVETGATANTNDQGNYMFPEVAPGEYTLVFSKDGYTRHVKPEVVVNPGQLAEVNASLSGEFAEMDPFIVQDVQLGGTEAQILQIRGADAALISGVSKELMSQAAVSDAADALNYVAGATVQDGKYPVVRGLPDRYVNSQMNSVRLPTADADKRAVQLDQFPSAVIETVLVSKTFTPDQQGDASGGAVNVMLKGIPTEPVLQVKLGTTYDTHVTDNDRFLSYEDGGVEYWGQEERDIPKGSDWPGAVGVSRDDSPYLYDWSVALGGRHELLDGIDIGGFSNFYYKRDASYYEDGEDNSLWVDSPGKGMTPRYSQGTPQQGEFLTSLYDVARGVNEVQWGWLGTAGVEAEGQSINVTYMFNLSTADKAILAEDTRGKAHYFVDGYDRTDPCSPGNQNRSAAPYIRTHTLEYTERTSETLQFHGDHTVPVPEFGDENWFTILPPEVDWTIATSSSELHQPDKRQFGSVWLGPQWKRGLPWLGVPPKIVPATYAPFKASANFTLGNLQRIWKEISEQSDQFFINAKFPFRQWTGDEGYVKFGIFHDEVHREYWQESFSNFNDNTGWDADWSTPWAHVFPDQSHPVTAAEIDVDYVGDQEISAWYWMVDFPVHSWFKLIGGARYEHTQLSIVLDPESEVRWIPPGTTTETELNPGDGDVNFEQDDILPSIGFAFTPTDTITFRGSYAETVARQTFKELTPIQQMEYLGADVFIGNPSLSMSAVKNYDLRLDYTPYPNSLFSVSWFYKDVTDPIEYVQKISTFVYTTPINYPEGWLTGWEFEARHDLGHLWEPLEGLTVGANAAFIESEVTLPADEAARFSQPNIKAPMKTRDMTGAPEYLYNLYFTYDVPKVETRVALFYTVRGDTLVAGAGTDGGNLVPSVYETEFGTLNLTVIQKLSDHVSLQFKAKNLTDPKIESVYRSEYIGDDATKTSYRKGREFSIGLAAEF